MSDIYVHTTKYSQCRFCGKTIPDYAICNCESIYKQGCIDGRAEAIDECIQVIDNVNWIESEHYINLLKQLKERTK